MKVLVRRECPRCHGTQAIVLREKSWSYPGGTEYAGNYREEDCLCCIDKDGKSQGYLERWEDLADVFKEVSA